MGLENDAMLSYLEDNARFADLFNQLCFHGEQVVNAEELEEGSETYHGGGGSGSRARDLKKRLRSGKELKILAMESQSEVNYIMPWRVMDYDCREYDRQIRAVQRANDAAEKAGDGPRSLKDMMDFGEDLPEGERLKWEEQFADYQLRLICVNELTDCSGLRTSLRYLFALLPYRKDKEKLRKLLENPAYGKMDEDTAWTISVLLGIRKFGEPHRQHGI